MAAQYFRVRAHRPATRMPGSTWPMVLPGTYNESVEAVDAAEEWLKHQGKDMQSFCDILFNGDDDPHTSVFRMQYSKYGIWNREGVPWPVDYIDEDGAGAASHLVTHPHFIAEGEDDLPPPPPPSESEKSEKGEEATKMKIDDKDEDEEDDEWEEDEDGEDEAESDSEGDDDEDSEEDEEDTDDSENGDSDDSDDEDDQGEDDGEEEAEEDEAQEEEGDDEEDEDRENESDEESESEQESEMPRLTIFAKMRGPKGWRKRAEIEELNQRNVFGFKVGVLDPDGETPGTQEYNVRTEIQFVESDETRGGGVLRIRVPDNVTLDDFTQLKSGWIIAQVPYYDQDDA